MALTWLWAGLSAFGGALLTAPLWMRVARATGLLDRPGPLKVQQVAVPYLGGAAVLAGILVAAWTRVRAEEVSVRILVPLGIALALGVADDAFSLPVAARVLGEIGLGIALAWAVPTRFGSAAWIPVVLLALLLVNGVNLLDGLDGLAAAVVAAAGVGFALLLAGSGRIAGASLVGAVGGFLFFNRPPARLYLGDGGSYLLGA
ncbi:MAG: hypothetical protein ACRD0B_00870, partial [Acidimicrobiales bacterium]